MCCSSCSCCVRLIVITLQTGIIFITVSCLIHPAPWEYKVMFKTSKIPDAHNESLPKNTTDVSLSLTVKLSQTSINWSDPFNLQESISKLINRRQTWTIVLLLVTIFGVLTVITQYLCMVILYGAITAAYFTWSFYQLTTTKDAFYLIDLSVMGTILVYCICQLIGYSIQTCCCLTNCCPKAESKPEVSQQPVAVPPPPLPLAPSPIP